MPGQCSLCGCLADTQPTPTQEEEKAAEKAMTDALLKLGNLVHDSVAVDNNEVRLQGLWAACRRAACHAPRQDNNPVERTWGQPRDEPGLPNHVDLVSMLDFVDLEKGQEVAGSRGYYLKGAVRQHASDVAACSGRLSCDAQGVLLNMALINYALAFLVRRGFTPVQTPFFMRKACALMSSDALFSKSVTF